VYEQSQLVDRHPDGVAPDPAVSLATIDVIRDHARLHPTIVLPSHDLESVARLEAGTVFEPAVAAL
jgi:glyoxylase-like metal-dependent hydrolase (beta-lactamase superfamily II)